MILKTKTATPANREQKTLSKLYRTSFVLERYRPLQARKIKGGI